MQTDWKLDRRHKQLKQQTAQNYNPKNIQDFTATS